MPARKRKGERVRYFCPLLHFKITDFEEKQYPRLCCPGICGGHANLAGLSLLDIRTSLDSPINFLGRFAIEICRIFVHLSVKFCLQNSKNRPPNSIVHKFATVDVIWSFHINLPILFHKCEFSLKRQHVNQRTKD